MVPEKERKAPFVSYEEVKIEPPSMVDLSSEDPVNFYAHILGRDHLSIDEENLNFIRGQLNAVDPKLTANELRGIITVIYAVRGPAPEQNDLPGKQQYLKESLERAIKFIRTGQMPQATIQAPPSPAVQPPAPADKPGNPQGQAGFLVRNFIGKPIASQDIGSLQIMLMKAGVSELQFNKIIADLYSMGMGKNVTAKKITEQAKKIRLNLLLQNLPKVIEKETGRPVPSIKDKAMLENPGGIDMNDRLLDLKEHTDGYDISVSDEKMLELIPVDGVSPRVLEFVPVTPGMLKVLLEK
jgi:hypothetical protein